MAKIAGPPPSQTTASSADIHAEHDEFAVGEVDEIHHAPDQGQTRGEQRINGPQQEATDDHLHHHHRLTSPKPAATPRPPQSGIGRRFRPDQFVPIRAYAGKMPPRPTREASLAQLYDVTIITVRPGTHPQALAVLGNSLADDGTCWRAGIPTSAPSIRSSSSATPADAAATLDARFAAQNARQPVRHRRIHRRHDDGHLCVVRFHPADAAGRIRAVLRSAHLRDQAGRLAADHRRVAQVGPRPHVDSRQCSPP